MRTIVSALENIYNKELVFKHKNESSQELIAYGAYSDKVKGEISANLDADGIIICANRYGFEKSNLAANDLSIVKELRNQLAHGGLSFSEAGRKSIEEFIRIKNAVVFSMRDVLDKIATYITEEGYRA